MRVPAFTFKFSAHNIPFFFSLALNYQVTGNVTFEFRDFTLVCKGIDAALTKLGLDWLTILVVKKAEKKKFFGLTASFKLY